MSGFPHYLIGAGEAFSPKSFANWDVRWKKWLQPLALDGMAGMLARHSSVYAWDGETLVLQADERMQMYCEPLYAAKLLLALKLRRKVTPPGLKKILVLAPKPAHVPQPTRPKLRLVKGVRHGEKA